MTTLENGKKWLFSSGRNFPYEKEISFVSNSCHKINMGTNFENPHGENLDLRVKMRFTTKNCSSLKQTLQ